jgi:RNA polymerase sigma-70 factor (ECF subfamily)
MPDSTPNGAAMVDHLFRTRAGQMVAYLTRLFGPAHLELVEEVVQDALLKALQTWPYSGVPANPGGWLFRVARNGALDVLRRDKSFGARAAAVAAELSAGAQRSDADFDRFGETLADDELRMIFMCCHPLLPRDARVALSLKTVGGFSVEEIARAFLAAPPTIAQRLVRAKRLIRENALSLDLPPPADFPERLDSVLEVIYLLFNEGYTAHRGDELVRVDLCREALRLARLVADAPATAHPAAHALAALIALQGARLDARVDHAGELVLLEDQDRHRWDARLIALGFQYLERSACGPVQTSYHLQAAIAAAHAGTSAADATPWPQILALYDELLSVAPGPVVILNRAVALSKVRGAHAALEELRALEDDPALAGYYLLPSIKGRLLEDLDRRREAADCYREALTRPCSDPERRFLSRRLQRLRDAQGAGTAGASGCTGIESGD